MNRSFFAALLVTISALALVLWLYRITSGDWSAVAAVVQAYVATALVWATWGSIARSDKQIEKANEQISLSQEQFRVAQLQTEVLKEQVEVARQQLGYSSEPHILVSVNPHINEEMGGMAIEIVNLSGFPLHISRILVDEVYAYPVTNSLNIIKRNLQPAEHSSALLMRREDVEGLDMFIGGPFDGDDRPDIWDNILESEPYPHDWFPKSSMSIEFYYGPSGARPYLAEYRFALYRMSKTTAIERYWRIELVQTGFSRIAGDGSFIPLYRFTIDGERRPVEIQVE